MTVRGSRLKGNQKSSNYWSYKIAKENKRESSCYSVDLGGTLGTYCKMESIDGRWKDHGDKFAGLVVSVKPAMLCILFRTISRPEKGKPKHQTLTNLGKQ